MDIIIRNIRSKRDDKIICEVLNRLGFEFAKISRKEKERIVLEFAIQKGLKSGFVLEKDVMKTLRKIQ